MCSKGIYVFLLSILNIRFVHLFRYARGPHIILTQEPSVVCPCFYIIVYSIFSTTDTFYTLALMSPSGFQKYKFAHKYNISYPYCILKGILSLFRHVYSEPVTFSWWNCSQYVSLWLFVTFGYIFKSSIVFFCNIIVKSVLLLGS